MNLYNLRKAIADGRKTDALIAVDQMINHTEAQALRAMEDPTEVMKRTIATGEQRNLAALAHWRELLEQGYTAEDIMVFADRLAGECYALALTLRSITGTAYVTDHPTGYSDRLRRLEQALENQYKEALCHAVTQHAPDKAALIMLEVGYAAGFEDGRD